MWYPELSRNESQECQSQNSRECSSPVFNRGDNIAGCTTISLMRRCPPQKEQGLNVMAARLNVKRDKNMRGKDKSSVFDAENLVSQDCETKASDPCNASLFNYECFLLIAYGSCALSAVVLVGELASGADHRFHVRYMLVGLSMRHV